MRWPSSHQSSTPASSRPTRACPTWRGTPGKVRAHPPPRALAWRRARKGCERARTAAAVECCGRPPPTGQGNARTPPLTPQAPLASAQHPHPARPPQAPAPAPAPGPGRARLGSCGWKACHASAPAPNRPPVTSSSWRWAGARRRALAAAPRLPAQAARCGGQFRASGALPCPCNRLDWPQQTSAAVLQGARSRGPTQGPAPLPARPHLPQTPEFPSPFLAAARPARPPHGLPPGAVLRGRGGRGRAARRRRGGGGRRRARPADRRGGGAALPARGAHGGPPPPRCPRLRSGRASRRPAARAHGGRCARCGCGAARAACLDVLVCGGAHVLLITARACTRARARAHTHTHTHTRTHTTHTHTIQKFQPPFRMPCPPARAPRLAPPAGPRQRDSE